ncbi:MAG: methyltransferase [Bacteroides sp.]
MANSYFQFKQFTVWQGQCAMKVGTDGVLLGAWTPVETARRILDVGTGTGLVALMLAQRSRAAVVALEIDPDAALQASENAARSPWKERIKVLQTDFRHYHSEQLFDVIVSNPPYFIASLPCPDGQRTAARHNGGLTYSELLQGVSALLTPEGFFTLIIPADVAERVIETARGSLLYPLRQLSVLTKPGGPPKRTLITFSFRKQECQSEELLTEIARHQYSEAYKALTKEYYLKM